MGNHELEGHAPEVHLGERALVARLHRAVVDEHDAPLLQRAHRRAHVGGAEEVRWNEGLVRVGLGAPEVPKAVKALQQRGVVFVDHGAVQPSDKGALTQVYLGGVTFELVVSPLQP